MPSSVSFRFPFTPPEPREAEALARAAAFLRRAANEVESRRLRSIGCYAGSSPLDDLPAALSAAGHLCDAVVDSATD
jgi:CO/xanthine dehydrogenase FAD-binding subunit